MEISLFKSVDMLWMLPLAIRGLVETNNNFWGFVPQAEFSLNV